MTPGDKILLVYKKELNPMFEIVKGTYVGMQDNWIYLDVGKYNRNKIKSIRNLTEEETPPRIEDE